MGLLIGDDLWAVVIFTAVFLLLVDLVHRRKFWTAHYPPGPVPLPWLGNLLQVDFENMPYSLYKLRSRYGDVFSLQIAWKPVVVINGLKAVRELLVTYGEDTADRPLLPIYNHLGCGHKSKEHPFNPSTLLDKAVSNVIASLVYAHRFEYEDPFFNRMLKTLKESFGEDTTFMAELLNAIPVLLHIPGMTSKVLPKLNSFITLMDKMLIEHKKSWDPAQPPRDMTDAFLADFHH